MPGVLVPPLFVTLLPTLSPGALTSVLGILPAQHPAAGPQGETPWMKADGQGCWGGLHPGAQLQKSQGRPESQVPGQTDADHQP